MLISKVYAQNFSISGYIKDKSNGESTPGATILIKEINKATSANQYGFYSITVPKGKYTLVFSFLGYETQTQTIELNKNTSININLNPGENQLGEVEISTDNPDKNVSST
ncbi:MAG TPA: carboxypeptidase-like regulatory domain-containing protein, partial [Bacteroidia bacterium]|nr:carboxypeptidase-like regulatory domain-containing protein [Bacteroidia bacterium]